MHKIKRVVINGFKSIEENVSIELTDLTAFIGANNVGKSNIIEAIFKVLGRDWVTVNTFDERDVSFEDASKDIDIKIEFEPPLQFIPFKGMDPIDVPILQFVYTTYKIGELKGSRRLEKKCLKADGTDVFVPAARFQKGVKSSFKPLTTIPQEIQENIKIIYLGPKRDLSQQLGGSRNSVLLNMLSDVNEGFHKASTTAKARGEESQLEKFESIIRQAVELLKTEDFKTIETLIHRNTLLNLGLNPDSDSGKFSVRFGLPTPMDFYKALGLLANDNGYEIEAQSLGGGVQNAILLSILQAYEATQKSGAIFLLEEPELFLHPQMQRSFYRTLRTLSNRNQIIYVTHSPNFVTVPDYSNIRIVEKTELGTTVRKSKISPDPKLLEKWKKELDPERNELFFSRKTLFVEGDTEKLAIPEYCFRMGIDLDRIGVSIIEVGGKKSLYEFVRLSLSFGIKTGVIYDIDSRDFSSAEKAAEVAYNASLEGFSGQGAKVFSFNKDFESECAKFYGTEKYSAHCGKFPGSSKAVRARLIANDVSIEIPKFIEPIISWLVEDPKVTQPQPARAAAAAARA
jgi:predicted ATP-dependent endonuclease of OLD family